MFSCSLPTVLRSVCGKTIRSGLLIDTTNKWTVRSNLLHPTVQYEAKIIWKAHCRFVSVTSFGATFCPEVIVCAFSSVQLPKSEPRRTRFTLQLYLQIGDLKIVRKINKLF